MQTNISLFLLLCLITACGNSTTQSNKLLQGKWVYSHSHEDKVFHNFIAWFKKDGTYDGIEDGKVTVSGGRYEQRGDTVILNDPSCNPHSTGIYQLVFYATDSLLFRTIADSCDARRNGTEPFRYKRVKNQGL